MTTSSPRSEGEIKSEDEGPTSTKTAEESSGKEDVIFQLVLGAPSEDKESVLRRKLLEKKAQMTEMALRQKLLEKMKMKPETSEEPLEAPVEAKPKPAKRRSPSTSSASSSSSSSPPKPKKKRKKSAKPAKSTTNNHLKGLSEKGVLHRVIISPQDDSTPEKRHRSNKKHKKRKSKRQKKTKSRRSSSSSSSSDASSSEDERSKRRRHKNTKSRRSPSSDSASSSSSSSEEERSRRRKKSTSRRPKHLSSGEESSDENDRPHNKKRHTTRSPKRRRSRARIDEKLIEDTLECVIVKEEEETEALNVQKPENVREPSPIPSPKIFLQQPYMQDDVATQSTSYGQFEEGSIEARPFEELTDEEKATLSPTLLRLKEDDYQKRLIAQLPVYYPGISGCRNVEEFKILNRIEEGTFGVVYRALEQRTDEIVALKRLKMEKEHEGFPITSLREINMLMKCRRHPNVVGLREIVVGSTMDKIYLVMEFVEHDVKALLKQMDEKKKKFTIAQIKTLMLQLLSGVAYLHEEWVLHRDLKTSNLLLSHKNVLKIGDFGLAREYGEPLKSYTPVVVTLWYRSPELLLGTKTYSTAVDVWSVGCIFGEFMKLRPIWQGSSEIDQLNKIFMDTGTPNKTVWPKFEELPGISRCVFANTPYNQMRKKFMNDLKSEKGLDLLNKLLALDPSRRISAETAIKHAFFEEEPKPATLDSFPTWPSRSENKALPPTRLNPPSAMPVDVKALKSDILPLDQSKQQLIRELKIDSNVVANSGFTLKTGI